MSHIAKSQGSIFTINRAYGIRVLVFDKLVTENITQHDEVIITVAAAQWAINFQSLQFILNLDTDSMSCFDRDYTLPLI